MSNKNGQNFIAFCDELRAYVEEHLLFPDKHTRLSHKVKYTRKIHLLRQCLYKQPSLETHNEGTLEAVVKSFR